MALGSCAKQGFGTAVMASKTRMAQPKAGLAQIVVCHNIFWHSGYRDTKHESSDQH